MNAWYFGGLGRAAVAALVMMASTVPALAQSKAPPPVSFEQMVAEGRQLAGRLCVSCHLVNDKPDATAPAGLPSFRGIANRPDQTAERIRNVLISPHSPMPDVQLSRAEIERLLAYIDSLRASSAGPPLTPRAVPSQKPVYPDPS